MAVHAAPSGVVGIDDAYNASPDSTVAALRALASMSASGRRWAVLGAMRELGDETASEHARVGREAATLGVDVVLAVGPDATGIAAGASAVSGWSGATHEVPDVSAAATMVRTHTRAGDVVLVKASNSERLWRVAEELLDDSGARHEEARA
jgi:UDP-N-acetylmuramoyl-tripeptide--D-alanyl-D-alanine ligase